MTGEETYLLDNTAGLYLPCIYETCKLEPKRIKVKLRFFCSWNNWAWYATEYDRRDKFFGYIKKEFNDIGYFSLKELEALRGPKGEKVQRDTNFPYEGHTLDEVIDGKV